MSIFLTFMFFYPLVAISHFFKKVYSSRGWAICFAITLLITATFGSWVFIDMLGGGGKNKDGLKYLLGIPTSYCLGLTISIWGCLHKERNKLTRNIGMATLLLTIISVVAVALRVTNFDGVENLSALYSTTLFLTITACGVTGLFSAAIDAGKNDDRSKS